MILDKFFMDVIISDYLRRIAENNFHVISNIIKAELCSGGRGTILDIGCGSGMFSLLFDENNYTGLDISERCIAYAKKRRKRNFMVMNATSLTFPDAYFKNILIFGVLHHLPDREAKAVLSEASRVFSGDGKILIIEDIPTLSRFNILGKMMHYFDLGKYIREFHEYSNLFSNYLSLGKSYAVKSGICDYGVFVFEKKKEGNTA